MAIYRIHKLKETARQQFRWAPHTVGVSYAKPRDYEPCSETEGTGPYSVWLALKDTQQALQVGDILESDRGELRIYKYVGFESVQWHIPEPKPPTEAVSCETSDPPVAR
jgi:hypothetical protein